MGEVDGRHIPKEDEGAAPANATVAMAEVAPGTIHISIPIESVSA
jgi:hypothetical protein